MIYEVQSEEKFKFRVNPPLFLPFYNVWGENAYTVSEPFSYDPFTIGASSTSGSPVVLAGESFYGFMENCGGRFEYDGSMFLTVTVPKGQRLYASENCNPFDEWKKYSAAFADGKQNRDFWSDLEYCTWVEQAKQAALSGVTNSEVMNERFIYDYLERVKKLSLPCGKFTIDDGWAVGSMRDNTYSLGSWEVDRKKFPNFEKMIADIKNEGFIPGLWLTPFTFTRDCCLAKENPSVIGTPYNEKMNWYNILPREDILTGYYRKIFEYYIGVGFMKFKLDISYGPKDEMIELLRIINGVIKSINPDVEVETHIPDIFATRYADTVRINDAAFDPDGNWRKVVSGHYVVCRNSSPDRILNLDHIGTNAPLSCANDYLEHLDILMQYAKESGGYPTVSYLPDIFSQEVCERVAREINGLYSKDGKRRDL